MRGGAEGTACCISICFAIVCLFLGKFDHTPPASPDPHPAPVHKAAGDAVIGGTVNMGGALRIRASRCAALCLLRLLQALTGPAVSLHLFIDSSMARWGYATSVCMCFPDLMCQDQTATPLQGWL